jgi:hypothetical protein
LTITQRTSKYLTMAQLNGKSIDNDENNALIVPTQR